MCFSCFILHNWSDAYCVWNSAVAVRALIRALKAGSTLLVNDTALPEFREMRRWEESTPGNLDVAMLTWLNTREREIREFRILFEMMDALSKWVGATLSLKSNVWEVEAGWDPQEA